VKPTSVEIGVVGKNKQFTLLSEGDIGSYL